MQIDLTVLSAVVKFLVVRKLSTPETGHRDHDVEDIVLLIQMECGDHRVAQCLEVGGRWGCI